MKLVMRAAVKISFALKFILGWKLFSEISVMSKKTSNVTLLSIDWSYVYCIYARNKTRVHGLYKLIYMWLFGCSSVLTSIGPQCWWTSAHCRTSWDFLLWRVWRAESRHLYFPNLLYSLVSFINFSFSSSFCIFFGAVILGLLTCLSLALCLSLPTFLTIIMIIMIIMIIIIIFSFIEWKRSGGELIARLWWWQWLIKRVINNNNNTTNINTNLVDWQNVIIIIICQISLEMLSEYLFKIYSFIKIILKCLEIMTELHI